MFWQMLCAPTAFLSSKKIFLGFLRGSGSFYKNLLVAEKDVFSFSLFSQKSSLRSLFFCIYTDLILRILEYQRRSWPLCLGTHLEVYISRLMCYIMLFRVLKCACSPHRGAYLERLCLTTAHTPHTEFCNSDTGTGVLTLTELTLHIIVVK